MSTNLASMVFELSANTAKLTEGVTRAFETINAQAEKFKANFEKIGAAIGIGIGANEFREFINGAIEAQDAALKFSQKIGVATDSVAGLVSAAAKSDIGIQALQTGMVKLADNAAKAANGVAEQAVAFKALGINVTDSSGALKSADQLLGDLADTFSQFRDGTTKSAAAVTILGKAGADLIPLLNGGSAAIREQIELANQLGVSVGKTAAQAAEKFKDTLADLSLVSKGVGNTIATALLPALNDLAERSLEFFKSDTWRAFLDETAEGFRALGNAILTTAKIVVDNFGPAVEVIKLFAELKIAQWALGAAASIAAMGKQVVIGASLWAEFTGGAAAAGVAMGALSAVGEGLLALIGGVPGLLALTAVGLYELATSEDGAEKASRTLSDAQIQLAHSTGQTIEANERAAEAAKKFGEAQIAQAQAAIATLEAQNQANASIKFGATQTDIAAMAYLNNSARIDELKQHVAAARADLDKLTVSTQYAGAATSAFGSVVTETAKGFVAGNTASNVHKLAEATNEIHTSAAQMIADGADATIVHAAEDQAVAHLSESLRKFSDAHKAAMPNIAGLSAAQKDAAAAANRLASDAAGMEKFLDGLSGKFGGPYQAAVSEWSTAIDTAREMARNFVRAGGSVAESQKFIAEATQLATSRLQEQTDASAAITRVIDDINTKYAEQNRLLGLSGTALQVETEYQRLLGEADKALLATMGPLTEADQKRLDMLHDMAAGHVLLAEKTKLDQEAAKGWSSIWTTAADGVASTFAKVLVEGGSLFDGLRSLAKQTVEAIIEYFAKLAVINPILNSIFGGGVGSGSGFNMLPTLANSAFGGGGVGGSAGGFGGGTSLFSPQSWLDAGKNLWQGWFGGAASADLGGSGVLAGYGSSGAFAGAQAGGSLGIDYGAGAIPSGASYGGAAIGNSLPGYGGYGSALGQGLGVVGGVYAGYSEYKNAGGGLGGAAGAVAYGYGTYTAGAAVSAFMAGGTAALGAIPVVGWVALAAMLVDKLSGGKLFGTAGKIVGGNQTVSIDDSGGSVQTNITKKGQHALFGGAYWKESPTDTDPATIKAAQDSQASLKNMTDGLAKFFKTDLVSIVGGSFQTMFDKNGKETGTSSVVNGVSYTGETMDQWSERLQSANILKVLDKIGLGASEFVAGLQGNADDLLAGVQDFANAAQSAYANIGKGFEFMALGADETLPQVIKFVEGLQQAGESLSDAYNRLAQAQAQYDQFVGQFKPAPTFVDPFEQSLANLYTQMIGAQHQANALAQAAGASGASIEDLTNIQKTFASQAAQLTIQLEQSAQGLAFSLGLTTFGNLDQINAEISSLQGKAGEGINTLDGFGGAIQSVSQKASDAINLLLGNLSPLNDQQKLQTALQGLRAGTVSQEQVLEIGRRLYASSQAYNDLFAQVSQYSGRGATTGGAGNGGRIGSNGGAGLSDTEQKRLATLLKEQAELQKAATMQQYQTLAQQIAEIASAKGEDWQAVLEEMGIKSADLETALGLKDDAALADYIGQIQKQTDSAGNNAKSIVDAIYDLQANLLRVLGDSSAVTGEPTIGGDPTQHIGTPGPIDRTRGNADGTTGLRPQPGTVGPGTTSVPDLPPGRTLTDQDAEAIGRAVGKQFKSTVREHADSFMNSGR